jgi:hypothetical protein
MIPIEVSRSPLTFWCPSESYRIHRSPLQSCRSPLESAGVLNPSLIRIRRIPVGVHLSVSEYYRNPSADVRLCPLESIEVLRTLGLRQTPKSELRLSETVGVRRSPIESVGVGCSPVALSVTAGVLSESVGVHPFVGVRP